MSFIPPGAPLPPPPMRKGTVTLPDEQEVVKRREEEVKPQMGFGLVDRICDPTIIFDPTRGVSDVFRF